MIIPLLVIALLAGCQKDDPANGGDGNETKIEVFDPVAVTKPNPTKVWMHYMPWFEDKTSSGNGQWGHHWTMANKNPDIIDGNGKRQIAAHYYPLIGPYASNDTDVLEYHFLLMKYAGIDGILIDWYGTRNFNDYPLIKRNTEAIIGVLEKVGLEFAIVYEDRTLEDGINTDAQRVNQAGADMEYMENNFFSSDAYILIDDQPLLLNFGPIVIKTPAQWHQIFNGLSKNPAFFTLYAHSHLANNTQYSNAVGEYIWVDGTSMETKYARKTDFAYYIGGAYPGFKDYYQEGGWGSSVLADIDHESGALFDRLLNMAKDEGIPYLQLITWNDFGEGTMIEPTQEFQYKFLEITQQFTGVNYSKSNLEAIYAYYNLKKRFKGNAQKQRQLTQAFYYLISLQDGKAMGLMNEIDE